MRIEIYLQVTFMGKKRRECKTRLNIREKHMYIRQKKDLWKTMANYRHCILHYPSSQGNAHTRRVKDIIYHFASI